MKFWQNLENRVHNLGLIDVKLLQAAAAFVTLIVVKLAPQILSLNITWFIILAILCSIKPLRVLLLR